MVPDPAGAPGLPVRPRVGTVRSAGRGRKLHLESLMPRRLLLPPYRFTAALAVLVADRHHLAAVRVGTARDVPRHGQTSVTGRTWLARSTRWTFSSPTATQARSR